MSTQLITHLKEKCQADDNVKILLSQWEFDQKLVGKALENIGGFYPHFSNHNASHSQQILVNIERILGKDIELLSATDTWLILEAAYWHDIGMLVDAKNAKAGPENADFLFMIKTIANDRGHDLHSFCKAYELGGWNEAIGSESHPFDGVEKYRQLIAEWFRRNHDKRIGNLVIDPFSELGISSPRTELLPNRLYRYLGQICMSHGMDFQKVMEKLPYKQTGLGVEDCHPRFIGCLLRLGDLFDLDDNRFCPVMAKHVSNMPSLSQHHKHKHLSLREFQLDKRTVKLTAECPDEMSYIETQNWFTWIREEFQNQMSQWNLIVPNLKFGSLPTIEQLKVEMEVKYEDGIRQEKILLDSKPMKFTIDEKNGIELLQGANLYTDDLSIYRELIQNAIDATMLRIWLEEDQSFLKTLHPYHEEFIRLLEKYPLEIKLEKVENINNSLDSAWKISISDQGVGISTSDLRYMQSMAGSSRNIEKRKIIDEMPNWMRPSGEFGIGLHSAFLLAKNLPEKFHGINISTYSYFSNENLDIQLNSPLTGKQGYCFITRKCIPHRKFGSTVSVHLKCNFNVDELHRNFESAFEVLALSQFEKQWKANKLNNIYDMILKYAPIVVGDYKKQNFEAIWDAEQQVAFYIQPMIDNDEGIQKFLFKGQQVNISDYRGYELNSAQYYDYMVDIYGRSAKEVLNINRDYWNHSFESEHKTYLVELFNKHLCDSQGAEADLLRLIFIEDKTVKDRMSGEWLDLSCNNVIIKSLFNSPSFYMFDVYNELGEKNNRKEVLQKLFPDHNIIDMGEGQKAKFFVHCVRKYAEIHGYDIFQLAYLDEQSIERFLGLIFFTSRGDIPTAINEKIYWTRQEVSSNFQVNSEVNIFADFWAQLTSNLTDGLYQDKFKCFVSIEENKRDFEEFYDLAFKSSEEYWAMLEIVSPYQIYNKEIKLLNLDDLSLYVANRKSDLSNVGKYKKLYEKLIERMEQYR